MDGLQPRCGVWAVEDSHIQGLWHICSMVVGLLLTSWRHLAEFVSRCAGFYVDGTMTVTHERRASIKEFYGRAHDLLTSVSG
jgi:hypothetical protein